MLDATNLDVGNCHLNESALGVVLGWQCVADCDGEVDGEFGGFGVCILACVKQHGFAGASNDVVEPFLGTFGIHTNTSFLNVHPKCIRKREYFSILSHCCSFVNRVEMGYWWGRIR